MTSQKKYKVLLIENSPIIIAGLSDIIGRSNDFCFWASLSDSKLFNIKHKTADIIIINSSYDRTTINSIISDEIPVIALSYTPYDEKLIDNYDEIIGLYNSPDSIIKKLSSSLKDFHKEIDNKKELSTREEEILTSVAKGDSNKKIADDLNISINTVISHRKNISHKLGINSIAGLTIYAINHKLIDSTDF